VPLKVHQIPDPILKKVAAPVSPGDSGLQFLIDRMFELMNRQPHCVGLAAPQVGHSLRVIVVDARRIPDKKGSYHGPLALLNPRIVARSQPKLIREGCLSVPDFTGNVLRDQKVELTGFDRYGQPQHLNAHGFEAVVFQHEVDHVDGKLFLDRVGSLETDVFRRKTYG
jgi:peptide deformylase